MNESNDKAPADQLASIGAPFIACSLQRSSDVTIRLARTGAHQIAEAASLIASTIGERRKIVVFGNGGSAADAQHFASEFVGRFRRERHPFPAVALTTDTSALTAIANDYGFEQVFSRQVDAIGVPGDIAVAISTSGRSENVLAGVRAARDLGMSTIGLTGGNGGALAGMVDYPVVVPSRTTARIQECHLAVLHLFCEIFDDGVLGPDKETGETTHFGKAVSWEELDQLSAIWRAQRLRVVWTNGCFDLLHAGHIQSLQQAKALGDILVVGVNADASVRALKGPGRPYISAADRVAILAALQVVDHVVVFDELTPVASLSRLRPAVHCKGGDYGRPGGPAVPEADVVESYGGTVQYLDLLPGLSTTAIVRQICDASDLTTTRSRP